MHLDKQGRPVPPHRGPWGRRSLGLFAFWLFTCFAICPLQSVGAQASSGAFSVAKKRAFNTAMSNGDAKTVFRIAREQGAAPFWMELYRDQLKFRLPKLLAMARKCRNAAAKINSRAAMEDASECEGFMVRSTQAMGDARGYFAALAWQRSEGVAILTEMGDRPLFLLPKTIDVAKLPRSIPAFSAELTSMAPAMLPYANVFPSKEIRHVTPRTSHWAANRSYSAFKPEVTVMINGHRVHALIDSGTDTALVMSAARAKALGLQALVTGLSGDRSVGKPPIPKGSGALFLAKRLRLGPLRVRNLMADVIPDGYDQGTGVTIGLPLLARFDSVVFDQSGMTVNAPAVSCRHSLPVTYAVLPREDGFLVFTAEADGMPIRAMIDTGASGFLLVGRRLMPAASEITSYRVDGKYPARFIRVQIPGLGALDFDALMLDDLLSNLDADFGFPLSWGMKSVRFDFANMSICLVPWDKAKTH